MGDYIDTCVGLCDSAGGGFGMGIVALSFVTGGFVTSGCISIGKPLFKVFTSGLVIPVGSLLATLLLIKGFVNVLKNFR